MRPVHFKGVNRVFAKEQPQYLPLPAHQTEDREGIVTTCWALSFFERLKVLFFGRFWFQQMTFGGRLQPQKPSVDKPLMVEGAMNG